MVCQFYPQYDGYFTRTLAVTWLFDADEATQMNMGKYVTNISSWEATIQPMQNPTPGTPFTNKD